MKHDVETLSPTRVKFTIEVPFDELQGAMDAAYKRISSQVTIPGFRKGKVPARVIDQRFGRGAVLEEVVNDAVPMAYESAVRESGIAAIGRPDIEVTDIVDGEQLSFTAEVDVRPEFDLPEYKGIPVSVEDAAVSDDDVAAEVDRLRSMFGTLTLVERASVDGDVLLVDLAGFDGDEALDDLSASSLSYELGTDGMLPGFDDAVRGAASGESREFIFTPEVGEFDGKPLRVEVTVTGVRERTLPELDDSFAQLASEFDTVDELKDDQRRRLERIALLQQGVEARGTLHEALLDLVDIPLPEGVIAQEIEDHFAEGHEGHTDDDEHRAEVDKQARFAMKSQFILDRIADTEELSVSEGELSAWLVQQAPRYGMPPQEFADMLVRAGQVPLAVADVRRGKALQVVLENAVITDASGNPVDLSVLDAPLEPPLEDELPDDQIDDQIDDEVTKDESDD
ncbi:MAG: trigger factor [Actinomycetes bacterium]